MAHAGRDLVLPPEFSEPGQLLLFTRYGDPRAAGFDHKWITSWRIKNEFPWFPRERVQIHKHFWPLLKEAFHELEIYGLNHEIKTAGECYHVHPNSNDDRLLSLHSWGASIDLNTDVYRICQSKGWSNDFVDIMEKHQVYCGQNNADHPEPCLFAMVNG